MYKIITFLLLLTLVACGTAKPKIQTAKKAPATAKKAPVAQTTKYNRKVESPTEIIIDQKEKSELLEATSKVKVTTEVVLAYINQFKNVAKENMTKDGIPASIILAQGILESGAGTGILCGLANNHFGIKCHKEWTGPYVRYDDDAAQECFRKYEKAAESYRDHADFLTSRPWYKSLFSLPKNDYKAWARGLKKAGYATDPKYPDKLIGIIERYQLQQYDAEVLGLPYVVQPKVLPKMNTDKLSPNIVEHIVIQGDTLYSVSKKYNISIDDLKAKNSLIDNAISIGQILIIR
jgi:flagellum-specific peptidoglycan hydrolase FlgJ